MPIAVAVPWKMRSDGCTCAVVPGAALRRAGGPSEWSSEPTVHVVGGPGVRRVVEQWLGRCLLSTMRPGLPCSARKNAARWETRTACCMLWVTMTMVTSELELPIVSSIRLVEVGSRAEQGSSISSTLGPTARARAMQSRCCWPPDSAPPGRAQPILDLVPQPGPDQARLHQLGPLGRG